MRYIEPHGHMVSRTTDDYEAMVLAGCQAVCEPAFWAGFDRTSADGFRDYFRQITEYEPAHAAKFLLPHFSWLCAHNALVNVVLPAPRSPASSNTSRGRNSAATISA